MKIFDRKVNRFSLRFVQPDLEKSFQEYYVDRYLWQLRLAHILAALFYLVATISEFLLLRDSIVFVWLKLGGVLSFLFGYVITYLASDFYKKYYQYFNIYYVLLTSISFVLTGLNAPNLFSNTFYTGIIICFVFNYAFIRQGFIKSSITGFIIVIFYMFIILTLDKKTDDYLLSVYISVAHFLGMFVAYLTEYENKRSYLLLMQTEEDSVTLSIINSGLEKEVENRTLEIQKANKILEESEARLIDANKLAGLGYWIWNIKSGEVKWSDEVYRIFELDKETFTPQIDSIMKLSPWPGDDKRNQELIARTTEKKEKGEFEQRFLKSDGSTGYYRSTFIGEYDDTGKLVNIKGTVIDITKIKKYELTLIQKNQEYETLNEELRQINEELSFAKDKAEESNRLKTEFIQNMSHEIRTPMNGVMGFAEMLTSIETTKEQREYYSRIILNSVQQLLRIIDDILEISTLETKQTTLCVEAFCLNDLISDLISVFNLKSKEKNIQILIKKKLPSDDSHIISDKSKIVKILSNLLENALKFTDQGFVEIGCFIKNEKLTIYVKDTGIGIHAENREVIFSRFSQENKEISKKRGGLGLGLAISRENAQFLGGEISVESEKGKGSEFVLTLPYKPFIGEENAVNNLENVKDTKNEITILIAEDEEVNYLYIETILKRQFEFSCNIIHANNGKETVDICIENPNIDIVLMDIKMPVMDGYEATKIIKSQLPELPVIVQTAYSTESEKQMAMNHGCNDFISKPIKKEKLFELIRKYI